MLALGLFVAGCGGGGGGSGGGGGGPGAFTVSPNGLAFSTASGLTPPSQTLSLSQPNSTASWSSDVSYTPPATPWLGLTPQTGSVPATVTANVTAIPAVGTHRATVTFTAGASTSVVNVTLTIAELNADFVSPYVATTGRPGDVVIRGKGFDRLSPGLTVSFGSASATSATYVTPTEIRASYPPLPAGRYPVRLSNSLGTAPTRAELVVLDAPAFPAAVITRTNPSTAIGNLIYDDERQSIYLIDAGESRIEGYRFQTGAWTAVTPFDYDNVGQNPRMSLSPDGTVLVKSSGEHIRHVNPTTLTELFSTRATPIIGPTNHIQLNMIAFANDGGAIGNTDARGGTPTLYRYDVLTRQFTALSSDVALVDRLVVASGNLGTIVLPTHRHDLDAPVFTYDATTNAVTQRAQMTVASHVSIDRAGSRLILMTAKNFPNEETGVYTQSFARLGLLPSGLKGFVITPNGAAAYVYVASGDMVRKFNLSSPVGGGFAEVLPATPIMSPGTFFTEMTMSADGGTLFIAGNQRILVLPAP